MNILRSFVAALLLVNGAMNAHAQEHKPQAITLPGPQALQLKAWWFKPVGGPAAQGAEPRQEARQEQRPVVVALHGCGGLYATTGARQGLLNARHQAMGEMLAAQGYHVIFPDSFGSRNVPGICSEVQRLQNVVQIGLPDRRADVLATQAWVRAQPWADAKRVAILGWSHGAMTLLASTDAGQAQVKHAGEPFKTAIAFYPGCVQANREGYRPNTQLTMLLGADDDWTLPEPCIQMGERLRKQGDDVTVKVYEGAVHDFDTPLPGVRTRSDVPSRKHTGQGVKVGQHPAAREDAWQRVREILARSFAP